MHVHSVQYVCESACLCAHMSECMCGAQAFVCGFLYAQDGGGGGCCAGFWIRLELCQRMDGGVFSEHIVKNTYIPPRNQVCTGFRFSGFWKEAGKGKNGIVDQLDFTLLLLLSQVWPTQQL